MTGMAEYILRSEILKHKRLMEGFDWDGNFRDSAVLVEDILKIPSADVEPVVRCRDCKYYYDYGVNRDYCCHRSKCGKQVFDVKFKADDFCSYGERKGGGEK